MTKQERTTRARVWRALAEKIDRSGLYASGLCYELWCLKENRKPILDHTDVAIDDIVSDMQDQLSAHIAAVENIGERNDGYLDAPYETGSRVLFCLMLAHEAEEEGLPNE